MAHWTSPGIGDVGSYQSAGIPVVGTLTVGQTATFKYVTRAITFACCNDTGDTYNESAVSFDGDATEFTFGGAQGVNRAANKSHRVAVRCKSIENTGNTPIQFIAELTNIPAASCPDWEFSDLCHPIS